jgi:hypothetical protein
VRVLNRIDICFKTYSADYLNYLRGRALRNYKIMPSKIGKYQLIKTLGEGWNSK